MRCTVIALAPRLLGYLSGTEAPSLQEQNPLIAHSRLRASEHLALRLGTLQPGRRVSIRFSHSMRGFQLAMIRDVILIGLRRLLPTA